MEDAVHGNLDGPVVVVDGSRVLCATSCAERLRSGEQRLDGLDSENHERGHCSKPDGGCLVVAGAADPLHDLFTAKFLQVIGGVARAVVERALFAEQAPLCRRSV